MSNELSSGVFYCFKRNETKKFLHPLTEKREISKKTHEKKPSLEYKTDDMTHSVITYNYHFPSNYGLYDEETGIVRLFVRIGKRGVIF